MCFTGVLCWIKCLFKKKKKKKVKFSPIYSHDPPQRPLDYWMN